MTLLQVSTATLVAAAAFVLAYWLALQLGGLLAKGESAREEVTAPSLPKLRTREGSAAGLAARLEARLPKNVASRLKEQIGRAGGLDGLTPGRLTLWAMGSLCGGLIVGLLVTTATGLNAAWVLATFIGGAALPFVWLRDQVQKRHQRILRDLPFHLDLLTLCVEAGLDFTAGVVKMVEKGRAGPLRDEFAAFLAELRVGKTRAEALEAIANRVGLPQLTSFLAALIQADRLGTGLARTLRAQAEHLRHERFLRAETKAGEAPVKILMPMVLFIFPTIWIILAAPLVYEWIFKGVPF